ncbi:MAG: chromosomal replication initiator protein DnaA [Candidatus Brocadiaceae bacterium]
MFDTIQKPDINVEGNGIRWFFIHESDTNSILNNILLGVKELISNKNFAAWVSCIKVASISDCYVTFFVPNNLTRDWLYCNCADIFSHITYKVTNSSKEVQFSLENELYKSLFPQSLFICESQGLNRCIKKTFASNYYTFENFVVGQCNRLAHAAAVSISKSQDYAYNPLFIHSAPGLGKTHLLSAIFNELAFQQTMNIHYIPCESFVSHYISTIKSNNWDSFRTLYKNADMLLVDDIQFLENLQGCREEFFHIFNMLYNAGKQIIVTSDRPPESISSLEERLISRFKWGLLCSIDYPSLETRIALFEKKAMLWGFDLPYSSASYLAENVAGSISEIEDAVSMLGKLLKSTQNDNITELAKKVVREIIGNKKSINVQSIIEVVSRRFNLSISQLLSKCRERNLVIPRQIAIHLSRKLTNLSLSEIGGYIGGRDHSTVIHADNKISEILQKDKNLQLTIQKLEDDLRGL